MSSLPFLPSTLLALCIATLYTIAGQAHFTARLTPKMAKTIDIMTPNSYEAFGRPLGLGYTTTKHMLGACDLCAAALLWRSQTRTAGLTAAVVGSLGGLYGQVHAGGELGQIGMLASAAVVGRVLKAYGW